MVQWAASTTRMRSRALGAIFEGQRLASVRCQGCQRYGASGAEPFTVEEVKVSVAPRDANSSAVGRARAAREQGAVGRPALRDPARVRADAGLGELDLVAHFGSPLDYHLEVCMTRYNLISAVFHRGRTERSGHYFTYILHAGVWMRVDDDKVTQPDLEAEATPMALELSEPAGGARVALLFYQREGAFTTDGKPPGGDAFAVQAMSGCRDLRGAP
eukprot:CAMPEP_0179361806 /NCGR_PEP_ID=MMETSP0797-20121207/80691_1 /TAXON_ID=47934 /ORGANISM="Dinophysis acuminata, Strain DAEP01" /LENGTH=215 /DNA_ID=CAMNT_0021077221 /DNA_START=10 /DNA_END=655 /DNA_ORIENTATION=-